MDGKLLRSAAVRLDISEIRSLLEKGAQDSINLAGEDGKTPLHLALEAKRDLTVQRLRRGHRGESQHLINFSDRNDSMHLAAIGWYSTIQLLLENGAQESINLADRHGKTPLHLAAIAGNRAVQLLLRYGAQGLINLADKEGKTPLHRALEAKRDPTVQRRRRGHRGEPQHSISLADEAGETPLRPAEIDERGSTAQLLLENGAQESINLADRHGKTPLHLAAIAGLPIVELLLEKGAQQSVNLVDEYGKTPLHLAATGGQDSIVQLLLSQGAQESINLADGRGKTPLHLAVAARHNSTVELLFSQGAQESINLADKHGETPLHLAAIGGHNSTAQLLLGKGAQESINSVDEGGKTPLHLAAMGGHNSTAQLLLRKGAQESINLADRRGKTPLHLAVKAGHDSTVEILLNQGAQESINLADRHGKTPLHLAATAAFKNNIIVQLLLEGGAQESINLSDKDGKTPLHLAAAIGYNSIAELTVEVLLKGGAQKSLNLADKDGKTPLHLAAAGAYSRTIQLLLEGGAQESVNLADNDGKTPVHLAAAANQILILKFLLKGGAQESVDLADKDGKTPLHLAAAAGHDRIVQLLLGGDALKSINFPDKDSKTSLHLAAEAGEIWTVDLLLAHNAVDPNPKDSCDRTPLWLAAGKGHLKVVNSLLHQGRVDLDSKDTNGHTPLSWAAVHHHDDVVRALVAKHISMNPDGSELFQQVLADRHENVVELLLSQHFDNVARGSYGWLSDLRQLGLEEAEIMDLVMGAMADDDGPWISANISNVPDPEASIDTTFHQSYCAHKRRNTRPCDDNEKNKRASFDRISEYISRDDMQRRVSLFCGLAGVLPPGSGPLSDFGLISFSDKRESIKVIYSDHWVEPQPRNEDAEDKPGKLVVPMRAEAKEITTVIQPTPPSARLISQLYRAVRGFINAAITLQQTGFCCDQFTVLTAPESTLGPDNVTIVHMNTIRFDVVLELARDMDQLQHEGLDDSALFQSVSTRVMGIMEALFQTPPSLPSTIAHQLHLCSLTMQLLCLGIVFYAQAHAGKLCPSYLAEPLTRVEIRGSSPDQHEPYIIAEQAKLACMGELVGDEVFVFRLSTRTWPIGEDGCFLSATCEEIVDSWGPASLIMSPQEASERISALVIRGGIIQRNGKSDDGVRLFHWTADCGGTEQLPPDAFGYKDKIVVGATIPAPPSYLVAKEEIRGFQDRNVHPPTEERATVLEATRPRAAAQQSWETHPPLLQAQHAVQIPVTITKCHRDVMESYNASRAFHLDELGSKPSRWRLTTLTANLQGGYQVLAQVGGEWQKQRAVPMKARFLDRWGLERKLSDFELPLGLQISLCTGVARRVPLRVLVREDLMNYVDSLYIKGWKDLKEAAKDAMESKERFAEWSDELTDAQRTCVQNVFWHVLNRLKDTGFDEDGDQFSILWPYKGDANRCVKVKPRREHEWLTVLEDKEWSATFAVATNLCLVTTRHRCRGERKALWPGVKTLSTSMWLLHSNQDPPSDGNHCGVERQIENERWYWNGEKNSRTWFSAQKSNGAIAELEFKNSRKDVATFATRQIPEDLRLRILQRLWDKMHSRGVLVEVNDAHHIGEKVFIGVQSSS